MQRAARAGGNQERGDRIRVGRGRSGGGIWGTLGRPQESGGHPARALAIVLCRRHTALKLNEIGERCGGSDYAVVSQAQHRTETKLRNDRRLTAIANRVTKRPKRLMLYVNT
jgi:hypothetical protein